MCKRRIFRYLSAWACIDSKWPFSFDRILLSSILFSSRRTNCYLPVQKIQRKHWASGSVLYLYSVDWKEKIELHNTVSFVATNKKSPWWKFHFDGWRKINKSYLHRKKWHTIATVVSKHLPVQCALFLLFLTLIPRDVTFEIKCAEISSVSKDIKFFWHMLSIVTLIYCTIKLKWNKQQTLDPVWIIQAQWNSNEWDPKY
jgi:hypothetical protein